MERRRRLTSRPDGPRKARTAEPSAAGEGPKRPSATNTVLLLAHIQAVIEGGGQIMLGTIEPIRDAAVAHDGTKTLAMLRRRPQESMPALLTRLNAAIATAQSTGTRVDEINTPRPASRYKS